MENKFRFSLIVAVILCSTSLFPLILQGADAQPDEPFFKIVLMGVTGFPISSINDVIAAEWRKLNLDVEHVMVDPASYAERAWGISANFTDWRGKPFTEGGFDWMIDIHHYGPLKASPHHWDWTSFGIGDFYTRNPSLLNDTFVDTKMLEILTYDYQTQRTEIEAVYAELDQYIIEEICSDIGMVTIPFVLFYEMGLTGIPPQDHFDRWQFRDVHWEDQARGDDRDLTIARMTEREDFSGFYSNWDMIYESLIEWDPLTGAAIPVLATSVSWDEATSIFRIELREDVLWHDGVPFNATDVWGWFNKILDPAMMHTYQGVVAEMIGSLDNVNILDEYTLEIFFPNGYNALIYDMVHMHDGNGIQPWHIMKNFADRGELEASIVNTALGGSYDIDIGNGQTYTAWGPIGTGPYKWGAMNRDTLTMSYEVVRFDDYWGETPWLETVITRAIPELLGAIAELKAGSIDVIVGTGEDYPIFSQIPVMESQEPNIGVFVDNPNNWFHYYPNMQHPIMGTGVATPLGISDPSRAAEAAAYVRKALACAMPKDAVNDAFFLGYGEVMYSHRTPNLWGNMRIMELAEGRIWKPFQYNLTKAMEYMELAGYSYEVEEPEPEPEPIPTWVYLVGGLAVVAIGIGGYSILKKK